MKLFKLSCGVAVFLLNFTFVTEVAQASHITCGQVITQNTVLDSDVGPCPGDGLVIGADNVKLNLNGHTVLGSPSPSSAQTGIVIKFDNVAVRNGTVTGFDTGIAISNGATANSIRNVVIEHNRCAGIALFLAAVDNTLQANKIIENGCAGVSISGAAGTVVADNRIARNARAGVFIGQGSLNFRTGPNLITGNTIASNAGDGVEISGITGNHTVTGNSILQNLGNGVRMTPYATFNTVQSNIIRGNALNGVVVEREPTFNHGNQILDNTATRNRVFDLADHNDACAGGTWTGNVFITRNQSCIS